MNRPKRRQQRPYEVGELIVLGGLAHLVLLHGLL